MRFLFASFLVAMAFFSGLGAVLIGTIEDGRKVLLKEDGSWKFATSTDMIAVKSMQSNANASPPAGDHNNKGSDTSRLQMKSKAGEEPERAGFLNVVKGEGALDIRKASWDMEKTEVKKTENLQLIRETPTTLEYKFKLIGLESKIIYKFSTDKDGKSRLIGAQYLIDQDDVNPARFFDDYRALKIYLRQQFGAPVSDENNWSNDIYKADEQNWGFAISLGFLNCKATWNNARTKIVLMLSGANHILSTNIEYFGLP